MNNSQVTKNLLKDTVNWSDCKNLSSSKIHTYKSTSQIVRRKQRALMTIYDMMYLK